MKIFTRYIVLIIIVLVSANVHAQNFDGYEQYVNNAMKDWKVQGCAVAVVKNGKIIYSKGFGLRDVKNQLPVTTNTLFAIGSCTKAFTAATVNMLVDDGKLDLDKPIINYFPWFKLWDEYVTAHITARDLLCHRSGLPRHDLVWYGADDLPRKELISKMQYLEPSTGFREKWQYQNGMFATAGYLVELVDGKSWEEFTQTRILNPLEMKNTNFSVYEMQKSGDFSKPYSEKNDAVQEIPFRSITATGPAGSINSSVTEMANWVIMQLSGGKFNEKQIVSEASINQMQSPQMVMPSGISDDVFYSSYGMGWMITSYRGHLRVEHGGNIDGFSASVCLLPKDSAGIVVLTNMSGTGLTSVVRNYTIDRIAGLSETDWNKKLLEPLNKAKETQKENDSKPDLNRVEGTTPSHKMSDYTGKYTHPAYGEIEITGKDDKLGVNFHGLNAMFKHYHYDVFINSEDDEFGKMKITFHTSDKGEINKVSAPLQDGVKDIEFTRVVKVVKTEKNDLLKYTGEYEISGMTIKIALRGETTLMMSVPGQPDYELIPVGNEAFNIKGLDGYSTKFVVDGDKATDLILNQPNGVFTAKRK